MRMPTVTYLIANTIGRLNRPCLLLLELDIYSTNRILHYCSLAIHSKLFYPGIANVEYEWPTGP